MSQDALENLLDEAHRILKCHYRTDPMTKRVKEYLGGDKDFAQGIRLLKEATGTIQTSRYFASMTHSGEANHRDWKTRAGRFLKNHS